MAFWRLILIGACAIAGGAGGSMGVASGAIAAVLAQLAWALRGARRPATGRSFGWWERREEIWRGLRRAFVWVTVGALVLISLTVIVTIRNARTEFGIEPVGPNAPITASVDTGELWLSMSGGFDLEGCDLLRRYGSFYGSYYDPYNTAYPPGTERRDDGTFVARWWDPGGVYGDGSYLPGRHLCQRFRVVERPARPARARTSAILAIGLTLVWLGAAIAARRLRTLLRSTPPVADIASGDRMGYRDPPVFTDLHLARVIALRRTRAVAVSALAVTFIVTILAIFVLSSDEPEPAPTFDAASSFTGACP